MPQTGYGPAQSAEQQMQGALQQLQSRVQQLEAALSVEPNGDVHLFAPNVLRIEASVRVEIRGVQKVQLADNQGNSLKLDSGGVTAMAAGKILMNSSTHECSTGSYKVSSGTSDFSGVVKCNTLIADTVTGKTYTPGAGNLW